MTQYLPFGRSGLDTDASEGPSGMPRSHFVDEVHTLRFKSKREAEAVQIL